MSAKKRWTDKEDKILVRALKANPHNLQKVFRRIAKKLDRSLKAVEFRWYGVLGNPEHPKYVGTLFLTIGRKTVHCNRKEYFTTTGYTPKIEPEKSSIWSKIVKITKNLKEFLLP